MHEAPLAIPLKGLEGAAPLHAAKVGGCNPQQQPLRVEDCSRFAVESPRRERPRV